MLALSYGYTYTSHIRLRAYKIHTEATRLHDVCLGFKSTLFFFLLKITNYKSAYKITTDVEGGCVHRKMQAITSD